MAIMCEDNGHQGVIWSKRKEEDIKSIQIVQTIVGSDLVLLA